MKNFTLEWIIIIPYHCAAILWIGLSPFSRLGLMKSHREALYVSWASFFPTEWRNACVLVKQLHTTTWSQDLLHTEIQDWKTLVKWALIIRMYSNVSVVWGTRMYSVFFGGNLNVEIVPPPHPQCGQCKFWNWRSRREENVNAAPSCQRPSSKYLLRQLERGLARWLSG